MFHQLGRCRTSLRCYVQHVRHQHFGFLRNVSPTTVLKWIRENSKNIIDAVLHEGRVCRNWFFGECAEDCRSVRCWKDISPTAWCKGWRLKTRCRKQHRNLDVLTLLEQQNLLYNMESSKGRCRLLTVTKLIHLNFDTRYLDIFNYLFGKSHITDRHTVRCTVFRSEQNVCWFQVSVDNPIFVQVSHRGGQSF